MLKVAVYGMLRVSFDLLGNPVWWWGDLRSRLDFSAPCTVWCSPPRNRHEAVARLLLDRKTFASSGAGLGLAIVFSGLGMAPLAALASDRNALSLSESRVHEKLVVPRYRRGSARHGERTSASWWLMRYMPGPRGYARWGACESRACRPKWLRFRVAPALRRFVHRSDPRTFINMLLPWGRPWSR